MANFKDRVEAEYEAIGNTLSFLPEKPISHLSKLELAGLAALIHNFYNGVENILKQIFQLKSIEIPTGSSWHQELLLKAKNENIISDKLADKLKEYLGFRHFFTHAYALDLHPLRIESLIEKIVETFDEFTEEINNNF
ncbi:hypothetical protein ES707_13206 [subsurface metagenome]